MPTTTAALLWLPLVAGCSGAFVVAGVWLSGRWLGVIGQ